MDRSYLNIPYDEHIIPFPNFASVILQHAREFPDKIVFYSAKQKITYSQLLQYCISFDIRNDHKGILSLIAKLYNGIPFELKFEDPLSIENISLAELQDIDFFKPPYVRLDNKAITLNGQYEFSQYNVLVAAQAVGNAFKLFREGAAYCPTELNAVSDLVFGVLAPLYFAKSIYFAKNEEPNFYQYAWNAEFESNLRDAVIVSDRDDIKNAYRLQKSFEQVLGLGKIISPNGEEVQLLGFEIKDGEPRGHCIGKKQTIK